MDLSEPPRTAKLLAGAEQEELQQTSSQAAQPDPISVDLGAQDGDGDDDEPPYSVGNEVHYFFQKGVPLGLSAVLEWGLPPIFSMVMAGHTEESASLQASLGYARVFFNISLLMPIVSLSAYCCAVIPGCIGAGRQDRIPSYFYRSMILSTILLLPTLLLQFFSAPIMRGFGVAATQAEAIGVYTRLMSVAGWLLLLEIHLENLFINLGYVRCASVNSFLTGVGIDLACTYLFIFRWGWGTFGAAAVQIIVKLARVLVWLLLAAYFRLWGSLFHRKGREPLLSWREFKVYRKQCLPQYLGCISGWAIFELQIMALTNVRGISAAQVAAGAIWVQAESTLAAVQNGWIQTTNMRVLKLLGREDPGATRSLALLLLLGSALVGLTNLPLFTSPTALSRLVSNDEQVAATFEELVWLLGVHSQSRFVCIVAGALFIPIGMPNFKVVTTFVAFYLIAAPLMGAVALTDVVTSLVMLKMLCCLACSPVAQLILSVWYLAVLLRLDWAAMARVVRERANSDKVEADEHILGSGAIDDAAHTETPEALSVVPLSLSCGGHVRSDATSARADAVMDSESQRWRERDLSREQDSSGRRCS